MAAAHQVKPLYYGVAETTGHPDNQWGFVVGGGIKLNAPMIGQGDYFQAQVNYTQGAVKYIFQATQGSWAYRSGDSAAIGNVLDGVYGGSIAGLTATDVELTTAWNVNAAYEHFWSPRWRTSLYGGYAQVSYNGAANAMLCSSAFNGIGTGTGIGTAALATAGCDNDWNTWWVGTRTQWNVTKDFYMGRRRPVPKGANREHLELGSFTPVARVRSDPEPLVRSVWTTRTTSSSASASIATSIPDRVDRGCLDKSPRRETAGGFLFFQNRKNRVGKTAEAGARSDIRPLLSLVSGWPT